MTSTAPADGPVDREPGGIVALVWGRPFPFAAGEDPDAAPGARPRTPHVAVWTPRRAWQNGAWTFLLGLAFLAFFLIPLLAEPPVWWELATALGLAVVISLVYVGTALAVDLPLVGRVVYLSGFLVLLCGGLAPFIGSFVISMTPYAAIMIAYLLPWRMARLVLPAGLVIGAAVGVAAGNWIATVLAVIGAGMGFFLAMGVETRRIQGRLQRAEQRIATLAVAAERERIARDLHDILGHSLTAVVVKAGLAARLSGVDAAAAREQMTEVEAIARQALADVRATATGFRQVRLATEIAGARSVLQAAGITAEVPAALAPMSDEVSELFGYVVREGVTNVIRHSRASRVVITASSTGVSVADDGVGLPGPDPHEAGAGLAGSGLAGSGLDGLRRRAERSGAVISTTAGTPAGTVLAVELVRSPEAVA